MPRNFYFILFLLLAMVPACSGTKQVLAPQPESTGTPAKIVDIKNESQQLHQNKKVLLETLEQTAASSVEIEPMIPSYNPLENQLVSFSMMDENLKTVLYALARAVGMNIIIDPAITTGEKTLTLHFEKASADKVLKEILSIYDIYYTLEDNIIRVKPFQERFFSLNFLNTEIETRFDVGGDVLGAGGAETASGLSGNFKLSGSISTKGNPYDAIEYMIKQLRSDTGKYNLDQASGTLYIKDTPSVIRSLSQMIERIKAILSQQVLIEARIIEVSLSDEFQYGIDWAVVRDAATSYATVTNTAWNMGQGLVLSQKNSQTDSAMAVQALETFGDTKMVSNPIIRVKHGKPAVISVGTSFTYKKSVETTTTGTGDDRTEETDIETSTVFDGLILGVVPFIEKNGKISLLINPIKSDVNRTSLNLESVGNGSQSIALPSVQIKEISTTISMHDSDVIILGGLMDKYQATKDKEVPLLSAIPFLGYLFKNKYESSENRELVIILTVTVI